jgi:hypothetical protein
LVFVDDLEVWVTRKDVKNMRLKINGESARIEVSCPFFYSDAEISHFIRLKRQWIDDAIKRIQTSPSFLAQNTPNAEKQLWRQTVEAFVPALVEKWEPIIKVKAGKLAYREMKSRWGSCQPATGRICINTRLALYPPECLEYVVVHELCHLRVPGHGHDFKALMDEFLPDWRKTRIKLR